MKTLTTLTNLYTSLSQNNTTTNSALGAQLINDQHRYLLQKYFDNEATVQTSTVGAEDLTLTAVLAIGATSATLSSAWTRITCTQKVNFSSGEQREVLFTYNSTAITWSVALTDTATVDISTVGVQDYDIPANVSKITNDTISIGQLQYQPRPVMSRSEWDTINFLPYVSDIPSYYFIYNGKLSLFPIPATTGNIITFNYKRKTPDLSFADYSTGTIDTAGAVAGSTAITGLATSWSTTGTYPLNVDISNYNLMLKINTPYGDGIWYPILKFNSDTSLTLSLPIISAPNITNASTYTIGQVPLLEEDFHDMLVYGALQTYFTSIVKDPDKYKMYQGMYADRLESLKAYAGTKSTNVDLEAEPQQINPNLFIYSQ